MNTMKALSCALLVAGVVGVSAWGQEGPVPATAVVSIESNGAPVTPQMLSLKVSGHEVPVESLTPVQPQNMELAILIDDGLRQSVSLQFADIKRFVGQLPPQVKVMVGYMSNGSVRAQHTFTTNREVVMKDVRIPFGTPGQAASPYFCLSDFVKHWPSNARAARVVLMITNGVDPYNGSTSIMNQNSPYVQSAQEDAQRAGVAVYSLFYGNAGMGGFRTNFSGQSYLQQVADATGGQSLYGGTITPVNFQPFLDKFRKDLAESYFVGFRVNGKVGRDELASIKVKANAPGIKVHAPEAVRPGI